MLLLFVLLTKKRKAGRKSQWPFRIVDDLIEDIIFNDEKTEGKIVAGQCKEN